MMKMNTITKLGWVAAVALSISACSRDNDPTPEIPPSDGTELTLDGGEGGATAENSVFVDLSAAEQKAVKRESWDLGFYTGNQFRVKLNNTSGASAIQLDATDLNSVDENDVDLEELAIPLGTVDEFSLFDDVSGDVNKTVIAEVSNIETDNKVYVINPIGGSHGATIDAENVYKIRVLRSGDDYTLQYAKLNATSYETLTVAKDADYNFNYVSFANGNTTVEPAKADWDFEWTWSLYFGAMPTGAFYPYAFSDLIFVNYLAGVSAAEVLAETVTYADFSEADLVGVTFSTGRNTIGSNWRSTSPATGAKQDLFYLIKDADGNIYKVRFISMGAQSGDTPPADGGKRGYPELEYKLVKRG